MNILPVKGVNNYFNNNIFSFILKKKEITFVLDHFDYLK